MARILVDTRAGRRTKGAAVELPSDVRVTNVLAGLLVAAAVLAGGSAAWSAMQRAPVFDLRTIRIDGDLVRTNAASIRALAAPKVAGNFFALDMAQARAAFEAVPWVRRAHVSRIWPNGLNVTIEEHRVAAYWDGGEQDDRLVNEYGEVFEANLGEVEDETLPMLHGPEGSSRRMLATHQRLLPVLAPLKARIDKLTLSRRGSWSVALDSGAVLQLGRGNEAGDPREMIERTARFVRTVGEVSARFGDAALQHADLRHVNGYALRLEGIETSALPMNSTPKTGTRR